MKSKISNFYKFFAVNSKNSRYSVVFKPILRSKLIAVNLRASTYAYSTPYFKSFPTKFKARCLLTGRGRGVFSGYFFSRIIFKKYAICGELPGFKKSRW